MEKTIKPGGIIAIVCPNLVIGGTQCFEKGVSQVLEIIPCIEIDILGGPGYLVINKTGNNVIISPFDVSDVVYSDLSRVTYLGKGEFKSEG